MKPRIYTYKVTFEEIPHWYWGVHKEKKYNDGYFGSPEAHKWMWDFYTPVIQILEVFPYTDEGWDQALLVEKRLILPDLQKYYCLNEHCGGNYSLESSRKSALKLHSKKNEEGKSIHAKRNGNTSHSRGVGIHAPGVRSQGGKIGGKVTSSQIWESTIDGHRGPAAAIVKWHIARGWDPDARIRIQ